MTFSSVKELIVGIIMEIRNFVQEISSTGARFLRRNVESKAWAEVERKTIIEKVIFVKYENSIYL